MAARRFTVVWSLVALILMESMRLERTCEPTRLRGGCTLSRVALFSEYEESDMMGS